MSLQRTVVKSHTEDRVDDASAVPSHTNIVLNNCPDVHIGPKYIHNNKVIIHQRLAAVDYKDIEKDEVSSWPMIQEKCMNLPYGVHLKTLIIVSSVLLAVVVFIFVLLMLIKRDKVQPQMAMNSEDYPLDKRFVTRDMWGAAPPCEEQPNNTLPVGRVIFIHTVNSGTCNNFAACKRVVLDIQDMHEAECSGPNTVGDIGYNFVLGSDGHIFVGRGWDKIGAHTYGSNNGSIGVAFVGDFRRDEPSTAMLNSAKTLLEVGVQKGKLREDYQLFGHCQRHAGFPYSPGINVLNKIQHWPHWNHSNTEKCANFVPSNR